jgi:hypothetical protein
MNKMKIISKIIFEKISIFLNKKSQILKEVSLWYFVLKVTKILKSFKIL